MAQYDSDDEQQQQPSASRARSSTVDSTVKPNTNVLLRAACIQEPEAKGWTTTVAEEWTTVAEEWTTVVGYGLLLSGNNNNNSASSL